MPTSFVAGTPTQTLRYPVDIECYAPIGEDRQLCHQRLVEESLSLFQIAGGGSAILRSPRDNDSVKPSVQKSFVASDKIEVKGISEYLLDQSWHQLVLIIQPAFSWSQLVITEVAFQRMLSDLRVFTPFMHIVHVFGTRTNDKERVNDLVYHHMDLSSGYELCYSIRYFELNGRGRGNPWSLRQTGVYQRCYSTTQSTWLLLNYSDYMNQRIEAALEEEKNSAQKSCRAMQLLPHLFIISAATRNWRSYIESLRQRLSRYETKAYSSRIDETYLDDYKIIFTDVQEAAILSDKVAVATAVIIKQRDVLAKCTDLHSALHGKESPTGLCDIETTLAKIRTDLQHQHGELVVLARAGSMTTQLLNDMMITRTTNDLRESIMGIGKAISAIEVQSNRTGLDTGHLRRIVTGGQKDAKVVKLLAHIAAMFLPASLTASLFGSTIFTDSGSNITYIGLYFAITLPLLLIMLLLLILLEKDVLRGPWPWP
ncbi:hypothetical protein F5Y10DRAFT_239752 [Nemania abortiva]|nr:hypothetical protein F5Y10DRAFT_239752 [Nemania abortiva]